MGTAVDDELPDNDEVCNAGNGVPAPLLWCALRAEGSEETSQDHDDISDNGNEHLSTIRTCEQEQVEEQEWCRDRPVDVTCPVDLAVDITVSVWNVVVLFLDNNMVIADTVTACHGEVRDRCKDDNEGRDNVIETLGL